MNKGLSTLHITPRPWNIGLACESADLGLSPRPGPYTSTIHLQPISDHFCTENREIAGYAGLARLRVGRNHASRYQPLGGGSERRDLYSC